MKNNVILAADIGTSSLKAGFIDIAETALKRCAAFIRIPYSTTGSDRAAVWESAFYTAVKALFEQQRNAVIEAVAISGNGPTLVAVDAQENVLKTLNWFDKSDQISGVRSFFLPHAAWFKHEYPDLEKKTAFFISCQEWLSRRLGAELVTVLPNSAYRNFYWDGEQCAAAGIAAKKFPSFAVLGSVTGTISGAGAALCGISAGTPIVACGPDFIMALLGTAAVRPGLVCDRAGTSEGINVCAKEKPAAGSGGITANVRVLPHAIEGLWNVSVVLSESGSIFETYRRDNGLENQSYGETIKEQSALSVLQKIGAQVIGALDTLAAAGFPVTEMRLSGGQAKCSAWNKLKADITGRTLLVPEIIDGELAGNAACAMLALNRTVNLCAACEQIVIIKERIKAGR